MLWGATDTGILIGAVAVSSALVVGAVLFARANRGHGATARSIAGASPDPETPLSDLPLLVVDLETTGLDVRRERVVSIGALAAKGALLNSDEHLDMLVHPERPIPPRSTVIHGITDAMVEGAPTFAEAFEELNAMLSDRVIVGHNIGFDLAIIRGECKRLGLHWTQPVALDVVRLAAALDPRERDLTLDGMALRWGITVSGRHTAMGDALMAAKMWAHVLPLLQEAGVVTLGDALAFERRARAVIANQKRAGW